MRGERTSVLKFDECSGVATNILEESHLLRNTDGKRLLVRSGMDEALGIALFLGYTTKLLKSRVGPGESGDREPCQFPT
jgi:hypothetical protein